MKTLFKRLTNSINGRARRIERNGLDLSSKIYARSAIVGIVGVGYVGEALVDVSIGSGYTTIGFDTNPTKLEKPARKYRGKFIRGVRPEQLHLCDVITICVPTPVENGQPDLHALEDATQTVAKQLRQNQLIIMESTVAPGTTRNIVAPILAQSGLHVGEDVHLSFSPERIDPGNKKFTIKNTPKIVSGINEKSLRIATEFYASIIQRVVPVSSLEVAEMSKMLENAFRLINISFINELQTFTKTLGIDIHEVINAAATKPHGFLAHYPGPGVGGHCIPVDPVYLQKEAEKFGVKLRILEQAIYINHEQPKRVVDEAVKILNGNGNKVNGRPRLLIIGLAYKPNVADIRESAALKIWEYAEAQGIEVSYHDPFVPKYNGSVSQKLSKMLVNAHDVIVIATNHDNINYALLARSGKPVIDTRRVFDSLLFPEAVQTKESTP